ncbi:hypothetical protein GBA52_027553 [Prunus armeniaca]|nr:hypothetical protein GBA52_027553 [Prunus armeniaca]
MTYMIDKIDQIHDLPDTAAASITSHGDSPPILALRFTWQPYGHEPYVHDHTDMKHVWLAFTSFYLSFCIMDEE